MITHKLPCHYVDYLCHPGLKTRGGVVPLQMYMGAHKNGQNSSDFLTALFGARLADLDDPHWTPQSCVPGDEYAIMVKGQGNDAYYVRLWDWIWDNQEQLDNPKFPALQSVYRKYFSAGSAQGNPISRMVQDAYFGNECIGFVSNYLRWIGLWKKYNGVNNHRWSIHFPTQINRLEDIRPLDLLEWSTYGHVALVDDVYGMTGGDLKLDISQCSGFESGLKGPMSNAGALLSVSDAATGLFTLSGPVPVGGTLNVRRMPSLQYASPRYVNTPIEGRAASTSANRR